MRLVVLLILVVGAVVGISLVRAGGGFGVGMVVFAILAVIIFASLPVLTGRFAAGSARKAGDASEAEVIDIGTSDPEVRR